MSRYRGLWVRCLNLNFPLLPTSLTTNCSFILLHEPLLVHWLHLLPSWCSESFQTASLINMNITGRMEGMVKVNSWASVIVFQTSWLGLGSGEFGDRANISDLLSCSWLVLWYGGVLCPLPSASVFANSWSVGGVSQLHPPELQEPRFPRRVKTHFPDYQAALVLY